MPFPHLLNQMITPEPFLVLCLILRNSGKASNGQHLRKLLSQSDQVIQRRENRSVLENVRLFLVSQARIEGGTLSLYVVDCFHSIYPKTTVA